MDERVVLNLWGRDIRGFDCVTNNMGIVKNKHARKILDMIPVIIPDHNDEESVQVHYVIKPRIVYDSNRIVYDSNKKDNQRENQVNIFIQFQSNEHNHVDDILGIGTIMKLLDFWGECRIAYWNGWSTDLILEMLDVDDRVEGKSFLKGDVPDDWIPLHHFDFPICPYIHEYNKTPTDGNDCPWQYGGKCSEPHGACYIGAPIELK